MRRYRIRPTDVRAILANPDAIGEDGRGNPAMGGEVQGRRIRVILAADDPDLVITVFPRRR